MLDCDTDVDVERDHEYRAHVAHQVQQYTAYVRDMMKAKANAHAAVSFERCGQDEPVRRVGG